MNASSSLEFGETSGSIHTETSSSNSTSNSPSNSSSNSSSNPSEIEPNSSSEVGMFQLASLTAAASAVEGDSNDESNFKEEDRFEHFKY